MGLQEAIQNIWSSDYVQKNPNKSYKASYANEYAAVGAYLNGGPEPNWSGYSKLGKGLCEAEKERRLAEPEPVPPDPPVGNVIKRFDRLTSACFSGVRNKFSPYGWYAPAATGGTPWPNGCGVFEIDTPHGHGIKYRVSAEMRTGWAESKTGVGVFQHMTPSWMGKTLEWSGWFLFPSAGNPNGFQTGWYPGSTLWEIGGTEGGQWGNTIGCTLVMMSDGKVAFNIRKTQTQFPDQPYPTPQPVKLDVWHPIRWQVKWAADGFHKGWIDDVQLLDYKGPTVFSGETIWETVTGFYSTLTPLNEVWFADVKITELP